MVDRSLFFGSNLHQKTGFSGFFYFLFAVTNFDKVEIFHVFSVIFD